MINKTVLKENTNQRFNKQTELNSKYISYERSPHQKTSSGYNSYENIPYKQSTYGVKPDYNTNYNYVHTITHLNFYITMIEILHHLMVKTYKN